MLSKQNLKNFPNADAMAVAAANRILELVNACSGAFTVALAGGNTPKPLYSLLASDYYRERVPWEKIHFFWGDERLVPPQAPESNFQMVNTHLLNHVPVPMGNIHEVDTSYSSPETAAKNYEFDLKVVFKTKGKLSLGNFPVFDVVLLGMGADGHTASLFPHSPALSETKLWTIGVPAPTTAKPAVPRTTFTYPVLNSAKQVIIMIEGEKKLELLRKFQGQTGLDKTEYPVLGIKNSPNVVWYVVDNNTDK